MTVNKYKILLPKTSENEITIPIEMDFDLLDRGDSLVDFEKKAVSEVINQDKDFEVARFSHKEFTGTTNTDINYNFYFTPPSATTANTIWDISYITQGFGLDEVLYFSNSFKNSFFKLDLYDSTNQKSQKNYVTIIIPTQQGIDETITYQKNLFACSISGTVKIKKPQFKLDFLGDKEGFFIYWLKQRDFLNIDTFYMTAKFFDAKTGVFIKMMNRSQGTLTGINKFNFPQEKYFYYKIVLDYNDYTYRVFDINTTNEFIVGNTNNPINWYEYINP